MNDATPQPQEFYDSYLNDCRNAWEAGGHFPALAEAVELCNMWQIPLPEWLALAVFNLIQERHFEAGKGNRKNNPKWNYKRDYVDYIRWSRLRAAIIRKGMEESNALESAKAGKPKRGERAPKAWLTEIAEEVRALLAPTLARGSQRSIVESYLKVAKSRADGNDGRYAFGLRAPSRDLHEINLRE